MLIAITATFTAEPVEESLAYWMNELGVPATIRFAPYNQVFQQLLDSDSLVSRNRDGINVHLVRLEDWRRLAGNASGKRKTVGRNVSDLVGALKENSSRYATTHFVCLCPDPPAARADANYADLSRQVEQSLTADLADADGVCVIGSEELTATYPVANYYDGAADELGHIPYTPVFFAALGTAVARKICARKAAPRKVIVLDCDQMLWRGVCGEDGPDGVEIDPPRRALQEFMMGQYNAGRLLCLCSKNNEQDVWEVFRCHPEMPLRREHLVSSRINWQPKSVNLRALATELKLGLDSFVFIDDNPAECAEVEAGCPEVLTLRLPSDADEIPRFLRHVWAFDHLRLTDADRRRTALYQDNARRERFHREVRSYEQFLAGLGLQIEIAAMRDDQLGRAAQLTQRTNQFNFTTIRRTEAEIQRLNGEAGTAVLTGQVKDRFGDYGLVGLVIFRTDRVALKVDTLLLSCRALGKGVEHRMLAHLGELATVHGCGRVDIRLSRTPKNDPAFDFLTSVAGVHRESAGEETTCRLPAAYAGAVTFKPKASDNGQTAPSSSLPSPAPSIAVGSLSSRQLNWIATEMYEAERIYRAVMPVQRAKRPTAAGPVVLPRNLLEQQLARLWEKVLGLEPVGVDDNFFELGGHSLLAVRLFAQIKKLTGKELPLVTLIQAPTIDKLAAILRQEGWESPWASLVPIKANGTKPPFYCVHGVGGNILEYLDLAKYMDDDQPFYGLQAIGLDGKRPMQNLTVEQMATQYIEEIHAFQPHGPYYLGGSSFGGLVAYEMAQQLVAAGEEVGLLAFFDTNAPGYSRLMPTTRGWQKRPNWWRDRVQLHWGNLLACPGREKFVYIREKARRWKQQTRWKLQAMKHRALRRLDELFWPERIRRVHRTGYRAGTAYVARPYPGYATLFRAMEQPHGIYPNRTLGWGPLVQGGLKIYDTPGHHGAIVREPRSRVLAGQLRQALSDARLRAKGNGGETPAVVDEPVAHA